jgi:hypothetical protein
LQNNALHAENENIKEFYKKDVRINKDMWTLRTLLTRNSGFGLAIFLLLIYYFLWFRFLEGKFEISVLVGLSGALIIMQRVIYDALLFYIDFTKQFIKVLTLWDTFDKAHSYPWLLLWTPLLPSHSRHHPLLCHLRLQWIQSLLQLLSHHQEMTEDSTRRCIRRWEDYSHEAHSRIPPSRELNHLSSREQARWDSTQNLLSSHRISHSGTMSIRRNY